MKKFRKISLTAVAILCVLITTVSVGALPAEVDANYAHGHPVKITNQNDFANGEVSSTAYYGGSNSKGVDSSKVEITNLIEKNLGNIYAGGNGQSVDSTSLTINGPWNDSWASNSTSAYGSGWWLYGGGNGANATVNTSSIIMNSGLVRGYLIGGGSGGASTGTTNIVVNGGQVGSSASDTNGQGEIYGGGNGSPVTGNTNITINGGTIQQHIVGGGLGTNADVFGSTFINIAGGVFGGTIAGAGGNKNNIVYGNTNVMITGGTTKTTGGANPQKITGGGYWSSNTVQGTANVTFALPEGQSIVANLYGSGGIRQDDDKYGGLVTGTLKNTVGASNITLASGILDGNVLGGGNFGDVTNQSTITLNGATVNKNIYGGSYSRGIIDTNEINLISGTVKGNVYGSGGYNNNNYIQTTNSATTNIYSAADVQGTIVASSSHASNIIGGQARVILNDMSDLSGFLTTYAGKTIETGTGSNTAIEFSNFSTDNTVIAGTSASKFTYLDFTNTTNIHIKDALSTYFGNYWLVDETSKVYIDQDETFDAIDVTNKGEIALVTGTQDYKTLDMSGSYTGVSANLSMSAEEVGFSDYVNINGAATGSTTLNLSLKDNTWGGEVLDLIEADVTTSEASAFTMEPFTCVINKAGRSITGSARLMSREDSTTQRIYWYLQFTEYPQAQIEGTKEITGITSTTEKFTFEAVEVDTTGTAIAGVDTTSATITGTGTFEIDLGVVSEGTHYYAISEKDTGTKYWTYDTTIYTVEVNVLYDSGKNEYRVEYKNADDIVFKNVYKKTEEVTPKPDPVDPEKPDPTDPDPATPNKPDETPSKAVESDDRVTMTTYPSTNPPLGDQTNVVWYASIITMSMLTVVVVLRKMKRQ
ncbi:Spy0128 family protein [Breznakia pachnodae]|uniref:Pilin isopeptide linkage protein n=1 Tax=Breznakia pachnodae TaxID=265178 RepID=A0ABU0E0F8_9FIRM|nr:FctA domain-containing protein [Breznakia pachnodae]MDQ0360311.1 pilin isopeptide linkage protein [Breznakia pachnodae]